MDENSLDDFYKSDFDVDELLNKQTNSNELKDILQSLNELKSRNANKMSVVLREKTGSVVLIAEQLQSLYKKITSLQRPVTQLQEEIQVLTTRINDVYHSYDMDANRYQNIHDSKAKLSAIKAYKITLMHTQEVINSFMKHRESIDFMELERLICNFALHTCILEKLDIHITDSSRSSVEHSCNVILRDTLLQTYSTNNVELLTRTVDMFANMSMLDNFKEILCEDIIKPKLCRIFCEKNLQACDNDMDLVYEQALNVLQQELKLLHNVIRSEQIPVDMVLDCYWKVVDRTLRTNLIIITAAGHPAAFFQHFQSTFKYLVAIGNVYGNEDLYKENASFIDHLKRFNLLVYYEIRHQYVSSSFEGILMKCSDLPSVFEMEKIIKISASQDMHKRQVYKLKVTLALDLLIQYLFSDKVFIRFISEHFCKSMLLLFARYSTWVGESMLISLKCYPKSPQIVSMAVCLLCDIKQLHNIISARKLPIEDAIDHETCNVFLKMISQEMTALYEQAFNFTVKYHMDKLKDELKNVSDIPRLYRKTNRILPQKHSAYINESFNDLNVLKMLLREHGDLVLGYVVVGDKSFNILHEVLESSIKEYHALVHSVLNAVLKTEESLKRLKSRNAIADSIAAQSPSETDESKIRLQIKLDIEKFIENVHSFQIANNDELLHNLQILIENC